MANSWSQNLWRYEVAIDLGTAFVRVATKSLGVVTIPAAISPPLRHGVIIDQKAVVSLLAPLLSRVKRLGLLRPRVVVGVPTDATAAERETLISTLHQAGAYSVTIVAEPFAAAIGADTEILSPYAHMIVDIGDGITDCAVVRAGEIIESQVSRIGCGNFREVVQANFQHCWGHCFKAAEVERIIALAGTGAVRRMDANIQVKVKEHAASPAWTLSVRQVALQAMIEPLVVEILGTVTNLLQKLPPTCSCEIIESGILLTGGGALLPGLRERLAETTDIQVITPPKPLDVVIEGLRSMLAHA